MWTETLEKDQEEVLKTQIAETTVPLYLINYRFNIINTRYCASHRTRPKFNAAAQNNCNNDKIMIMTMIMIMIIIIINTQNTRT